MLGKGLVLEPLKEGNNEAEWIVDLTTQADRQGRCKERLLTRCNALGTMQPMHAMIVLIQQ